MSAAELRDAVNKHEDAARVLGAARDLVAHLETNEARARTAAKDVIARIAGFGVRDFDNRWVMDGDFTPDGWVVYEATPGSRWRTLFKCLPPVPAPRWTIVSPEAMMAIRVATLIADDDAYSPVTRGEYTGDRRIMLDLVVTKVVADSWSITSHIYNGESRCIAVDSPENCHLNSHFRDSPRGRIEYRSLPQLRGVPKIVLCEDDYQGHAGYNLYATATYRRYIKAVAELYFYYREGNYCVTCDAWDDAAALRESGKCARCELGKPSDADRGSGLVRPIPRAKRVKHDA